MLVPDYCDTHNQAKRRIQVHDQGCDASSRRCPCGLAWYCPACVDVAFGRRLKARRERLGLSQHDLAVMVGIGQISVSAVERGTFTVGSDSMTPWMVLDGIAKMEEERKAKGKRV